MNLPPLPPLRKSKPRIKGLKLDKNGLIEVKRPPILARIREVTPAEGEDTKPGRWFRTNSRVDVWGGRCGDCGRLVRAVDLGWRIPPFGTTEDGRWSCKDCRDN